MNGWINLFGGSAADPKMKGKRKGRREIICEDTLKRLGWSMELIAWDIPTKATGPGPWIFRPPSLGTEVVYVATSMNFQPGLLPPIYIYMDQPYFHPANPFLLSQKLVFAQQILCFTASLPHVDSAILVESWVLVWELNYPQQMTGIFRSWRHFQQKIQTSKRSLRWIDEMQSFPFGAMVFTSLPDMSEVVEFLGPRFEDWEQFFMKAVLLVRRQKERNQP